MTGVPPDAVSRAIAHVEAMASGPPLDPSLRIALHFHPDRLTLGRPILQAMAGDGRYRSQFETGTSNGGLTAHPGGDRWRWESRIFGGAYDEAPAALRPVYGALDLGRRPTGPAPRFGSAFLRLTAAALGRATFCCPDSALEPERFATAGSFGLDTMVETAEAAGGGDPLDGYVEAHVHGILDLRRDVEALVLDPCYRGTSVESDAAGLGVAVEWHGGHRLTVNELERHSGYRGAEFVELGARLAVGGILTPADIGAAARSGRHDEQALKRVWHLLARYGGEPDDARGDG